MNCHLLRKASPTSQSKLSFPYQSPSQCLGNCFWNTYQNYFSKFISYSVCLLYICHEHQLQCKFYEGKGPHSSSSAFRNIYSVHTMPGVVSRHWDTALNWCSSCEKRTKGKKKNDRWWCYEESTVEGAKYGSCIAAMRSFDTVESFSSKVIKEWLPWWLRQ